MLILLPPSEGKRAPRRGRALDLATVSSADLTGMTDTRARILDALVRLSTEEPDDAATVLGLSSTQLDLVARNAGLATAPTARADRVYSGVLYDALDVETLSAAARRRATGRVAVVSGLFGLLRPDDRIPAYRLSGDATVPGVGTVAGAWRPVLGPAVEALAGRGVVLDLRSGMYAGFWRPGPELARRVATVRVLHEVGGRRQVVSHFNKATKGRLVRALLEDGAAPRTPSALAADLERIGAAGRDDGGPGWVVELGEADPRHGTRLDVVVPSL